MQLSSRKACSTLAKKHAAVHAGHWQTILASTYHALYDTAISSAISLSQILSIHLLHEASKGAASFWHPYLQQLPRHFTTLMAWPQQAVLELQLLHAQQAAADAAGKARSEWLGAKRALQELGEWLCC
jgi:hypothetical protein